MRPHRWTSIFTEQLSSLRFWRKPTLPLPSPSQIAHIGTLFTMGPGLVLVPKLYALAGSRLISVELWAAGTAVCLEGDLRWVLVEPFRELRGGTSMYGLRIVHGEDFEDLYVEGRKELGKWIKRIGAKTVMTDIEEDFDVQGKIGKGGQSKVYSAIARKRGDKVAVKVYSKQRIAGDGKKVAALVSEIEILRTLDHPDIVQLYGVYESKESVSLVLEYIPGPQLVHSLQTTGKYSESEAKSFLSRLLDILAYLSKHKVIHRDIKPENIILTSESDRTRFKLIDFGLAMRFEGEEICDSSGSPGYFAPEILMKRRHGPKVDVYTAGILMYTLLSGMNPFVSDTREETIRKNCVNEISFSSEWKQIHPTLISLIKVMTNFNPDNRMNISDLQTWLKRDFTLAPQAFRRASLSSALGSQRINICVLEDEAKEAQKGAASALEAAKAFHRRKVSHG